MVIGPAGGDVTTIDHGEAASAAMRPDSFFESGQPLAFDDADDGDTDLRARIPF